MSTRRMGPILSCAVTYKRLLRGLNESAKKAVNTAESLDWLAMRTIHFIIFLQSNSIYNSNNRHDLILRHERDLPPAKRSLTDDAIAVACAEMI